MPDITCLGRSLATGFASPGLTGLRPLGLRRRQGQLRDRYLVLLGRQRRDPDQVVAVPAVAGAELEALLRPLDPAGADARPAVARPLVGRLRVRRVELHLPARVGRLDLE